MEEWAVPYTCLDEANCSDEGHRPVVFAHHRDESLIGKIDFEQGNVLDLLRILQEIKKHIDDLIKVGKGGRADHLRQRARKLAQQPGSAARTSQRITPALS